MKVELLEGNPELIATAGALGCMDAESSATILNGLKKHRSVTDKAKKVLADSFGRGHGSVGDQANFTFSLEGVSRLVTLFFCQSTHSSFLQQSLRRAKAGGYFLPQTLKYRYPLGIKVCDEAFKLYQEMLDAGIPGEDARYILPLATTTNIQVNVNAREFCHYVIMYLGNNDVLSESEIGITLKTMLIDAQKSNCHAIFQDCGSNYNPLSFYPAPDLFAEVGPIDKQIMEAEKESGQACPTSCISVGNHTGPCRIDLRKAIKEKNVAELSLLKHVHFTFMLNMSIAALHQAIRQRTWDHTVETLSNAAASGRGNLDRGVLPPSITKSKFGTQFIALHLEMIEAYHEAIEAGVAKSEAFGLLPHSLKVWTIVHINGWNAIHSIGKRTCNKAQWEIRAIAKQIAEEINEEDDVIGEFAVPQCKIYGKCPEKIPCKSK